MKKKSILPLLLLSLNSFALETDLCDKDSPIETHNISTPSEENVETVVCKQGEDILVIPEKPLSRHHLLYAGLNIGMPYLGAGLTYSQLIEGKQNFHISASLDGSLGANGVSATFGHHSFKNVIFFGGTARGYKGLPGEGGFQMGPSIGISGGKKFITGHISLSYLGGYDSRAQGYQGSPELSVGLRLRLFRTR